MKKSFSTVFVLLLVIALVVTGSLPQHVAAQQPVPAVINAGQSPTGVDLQPTPTIEEKIAAITTLPNGQSVSNFWATNPPSIVPIDIETVRGPDRLDLPTPPARIATDPPSSVPWQVANSYEFASGIGGFNVLEGNVTWDPSTPSPTMGQSGHRTMHMDALGGQGAWVETWEQYWMPADISGQSFASMFIQATGPGYIEAAWYSDAVGYDQWSRLHLNELNGWAMLIMPVPNDWQMLDHNFRLEFMNFDMDVHIADVNIWIGRKFDVTNTGLVVREVDVDDARISTVYSAMPAETYLCQSEDPTSLWPAYPISGFSTVCAYRGNCLSATNLLPEGTEATSSGSDPCQCSKNPFHYQYLPIVINGSGVGTSPPASPSLTFTPEGEPLPGVDSTLPITFSVVQIRDESEQDPEPDWGWGVTYSSVDEEGTLGTSGVLMSTVELMPIHPALQGIFEQLSWLLTPEGKAAIGGHPLRVNLATVTLDLSDYWGTSWRLTSQCPPVPADPFNNWYDIVTLAPSVTGMGLRVGMIPENGMAAMCMGGHMFTNELPLLELLLAEELAVAADALPETKVDLTLAPQGIGYGDVAITAYATAACLILIGTLTPWPDDPLFWFLAGSALAAGAGGQMFVENMQYGGTLQAGGGAQPH